MKSFGACSLFIALHGLISAQALTEQGTAAVKFGVVNGEEEMPARVASIMRHLTDPENYVYLYDMENMFFKFPKDLSRRTL